MYILQEGVYSQSRKEVLYGKKVKILHKVGTAVGDLPGNLAAFFV